MIRIGVVGLGYYGTFHVQKYAKLPGCQLVAVVDADSGRAKTVAMKYGVKALTHYRELIGLVDAVSVVTPTGAHYTIVRALLSAGIHVLVEKAITETAEDARELIRLSEKNKRVLQVGHLERFNPAYQALPKYFHAPFYIETQRLTPFQKRGDDVSVVLDLMIHDIDLVHDLIPFPVVKVQAKGLSLYSNTPDLVNAVIHFQNGAVANLTASRVSQEPQRVIHLFQKKAYARLDMQRKSVVTRLQGESGDTHVGELQLANTDILETEIASFLKAVNNGEKPVVTGRDGLRAVDTALRISEAVEENCGVPVSMGVTEWDRAGDVIYDHHPETREPFFCRTSLVEQMVAFDTDVDEGAWVTTGPQVFSRSHISAKETVNGSTF